MDKSVTSGTSDASYLLIFTDLDGTLLDADTYGWKEALPALDQCRRRGIPVVLVSSKTRAEMESLHRKLRLSAPFISENGGGIFFSSGSIMEPPAKAVFDNGLWKWSLGVPYAHLIKGLREIRNELGWNLKGFSDMSIEEISCLTGLDEDTSRLAVMREFDEPFVASVGQAVDWKVLSGAAAKRGLTVTMGGRFYHLQGKNDKGQAMEASLRGTSKAIETSLPLRSGIAQTISPCLSVPTFLYSSVRKSRSRKSNKELPG